ncbi:MAG TPA: AAA family ATPase [Candidatus Saccharimonadales bacterium]|nr:AAA family ATPase [Candidatus Saccharimonadales bacterium]
MKKSFQFGRARFIRLWDSSFVTIFRYLFITLGLASLLLLVINSFITITGAVGAIAIFLLAPLFVAESVNLFVSYLRHHPGFMLAEGLLANPFNRLDFEAQNVLAKWRDQTLGGLLTAFAQVDETKIILLRLGLSEGHFTPLQNQPFTEAALKQLLTAAPPKKIISIHQFLDIIFSLPVLQRLLAENELDEVTLNQVLGFYDAQHQLRYQQKAFWLNHTTRTGGIGKDWAVSYTQITDSLTTTVPPSVRQRALIWPLFSRQKLADQISQNLNKGGGQNLLLVGEPGSGKQEIFLNFAAKVMFYQTKTALDGATVRILDVQQLLAQASSSSASQQLLDALFAELSRAGNVILSINQIDQLLSSGQLGEADVSNVLAAHLQNQRVHIIGTMTPENYTKIVKPNAGLAEQFSVLEVSAPMETDLLPILLSHLNQLENRYNVFFTIEALSELIKLAARYVKDQASPLRELDLLETIAAANHAHNKLLVMPEDVEVAIEQKAQVPLQVKATEQKTLLNLEAELHKRVIGQNRAIKLVSDALLRARAGLSTGNRPVGTFLFLGPTGVGKTETAKALAAIYFGSDKKLIRLDMTEYADAAGLQKLLGTDPTTLPGALTVMIQENPSAVVLFDEFEKAAPAVKNVLLQLLDEGRLTTNYGKVLDFTNAIIIATSNAGSDYIKTQIENKTPIEGFEKPLIDKLIADKTFSPELLNRFDGTIVFAPLSPSEITQVVGLQITLLQAQVKKDKGIDLQIAPAVLQQLALKGYDPVFGARALERVIKNDLETAIAKQIITEDPKPGSVLTINTLS